MTEEEEQELAAQKLQAIQRGNEARKEVAAKKALADSKVWKALKDNKPAALKEVLPAAAAEELALVTAEGTPLQFAVMSKQFEAAKALIAYDAALGVPAAELACWQKVQADSQPIPEGEEGEAKDVKDPEYQAELAAAMFPDLPAADAGHAVKAIAEIGLYYGGRAVIEAPEKEFDTMVGDKAGFGVCLLPKGDVYAGEYGSGGAREGVGALRTAKSTTYVGEWKEGLRHGTGSMTYADGGVYTGAWAYGKRHGVGTFFYANGDSYAGSWHAGNKHGEGKYAAKDAQCAYDGTWKHGVLLASKVTFLSAEKAAFYGAFDKAGRPMGEGAFAFGNGVTLGGAYVDPDEALEEKPEVPSASVWQGGACGAVDGTTDKALKASLTAVKPTLNVIICGAPASGKGTQCEKIVAKYGLFHVSTGDMLREAAADPDNEVAAQHDLAGTMERGELVSDELITQLLVQKLDSEEVKEKGWLLDGYPRTAVQAAALEKYFLIPSKCVLLDVPEEVLVSRVCGRRKDPETGTIYHLETNPPKGETDEETEAIMARLEQRKDDTEEALKTRLVNFNSNKTAIEEKFSAIALTVDGNRAPDDVWADIDAFFQK